MEQTSHYSQASSKVTKVSTEIHSTSRISFPPTSSNKTLYKVTHRNMRIINCFVLLLAPSMVAAFAPGSFGIQNRITTSLMAKEASSDETEPTVDNPPVEPGTHEELMYSLGVNLARQLGDIRPLVENGEELTFVAKGLLDAVIGRLSEEGQQDLLSARRKDLNELITQRADNIRKNIEKAGESMLETMSTTEGVETLESGVRLHILEHGEKSNRPSAASTVKMHYHGTLPDGTVFDSSLGKDEPLTIAVGQLIPGFKEGVLKMHEGDTGMVGIPCSLAYGEEGSADGRVPGGAAIFFKVQLIEVLSAGIGGRPTLLGADGKKLGKTSSPGLLGANGQPL